eukprot:140000-Amphidinium_carterae.2
MWVCEGLKQLLDKPGEEDQLSKKALSAIDANHASTGKCARVQLSLTVRSEPHLLDGRPRAGILACCRLACLLCQEQGSTLQIAGVAHQLAL